MSEATQTEKKQAQKERKAYRAKKRKLFFKTLFSRKIVLVSAIVVLLIILVAIFTDFLMPYNPNQISIPERNQGMSAAHWLGTAEYGRDLLTSAASSMTSSTARARPSALYRRLCSPLPCAPCSAAAS